MTTQWFCTALLASALFAVSLCASAETTTHTQAATAATSAVQTRATTAAVGRISPADERTSESSISESARMVLEKQFGVRVKTLRPTATGAMLDFRFEVTDGEKAAPLFDRKAAAYLEDPLTGAKYIVPATPKVGSLRPKGTPIVGRTYTFIFANPGRRVKSGARVNVIIGAFQAKDLLVL